MFINKYHNIAFPHFTQSLTCGTIASLWGNSEFDLPVVPYNSFILAAGFHDYHYGVLDTVDFSQFRTSEMLRKNIDVRLKSLKDGMNTQLSDPIAEAIVAKFFYEADKDHFVEDIRNYMRSQKELVEKKIAASGFKEEEIAFAASIIRFIDDMFFDFCMHERSESTLEIIKKVGGVRRSEITYKFDNDGKIYVAPWPFKVESFKSFITGYEVEGYPNTLNARPIFFELVKG